VKLESLDFVYMPSADPAAELEWFEKTLGAEVVFAIEPFGIPHGPIREIEAEGGHRLAV
jgi:hypothetical protein